MVAYKVKCRIPEQSKHTGDIECVACHGDRIYTGADDGFIKAWNEKLELVAEVKAHDCMVYSVAVNNDGSFLYSSSNDGSIRMWHLPSLEPGPQLSGHDEAVRKLRFDSEGTLYSADEHGIICIWKKGSEARMLEPLGEEIWDFGMDGNLIFTARDRDLVVTLVQENRSSLVCKASFPGRAPICLFKDRVYFVAREGNIILAHYNVSRKYEKIAEMKGHDRIINALVASDTQMFSGGYDNTVRVWDLETHKCVCTVELDGLVNSIVIAPSQDCVYVGGANSMLVKIASK